MSRREIAACTIVKDEPLRLPVWLRYYQRHIHPDDIFVLDHDSQDTTCIDAANTVHRVPIHWDFGYNHTWLQHTVVRFLAFLALSYKRVLFAESDEFLVPNPVAYPGGLKEYLKQNDAPCIRARGFDLLHMDGEPDLDWGRPFLEQRSTWAPSPKYSKQLVNSWPPHWNLGFHVDQNNPSMPVDPDFMLIHVHRADFKEALSRHQRAVKLRWNQVDLDKGRGKQSRITNEQEVRDFCSGHLGVHEQLFPEPIPDYMKGAL